MATHRRVALIEAMSGALRCVHSLFTRDTCAAYHLKI
jgi:hypothetical protein